ncbi:MAG TPA: nuclear transport factor 2 family protein [Pseudolabrys sp.]|jgi:ketosteroid isomerase-like protein|nr:nuclear transport factor 2 family protein [Pseudolabrys sp.]
MADAVTRELAEGFYKALADLNFEALETYLDDNVSWTMRGPVDVLPYCGCHTGKATVLRLLGRDIPALFDKRRLLPHSMLVDGDYVAVFGVLTANRAGSRRKVTCRIAQFIRFAGGKVVAYTSILDSFDAAEQMLGRPLKVARAGNGHALAV